MSRSAAEILWEVARVLARDAAKVSRAAGAAPPPPLLFFTDPARTPRPWEVAEGLPSGAGVVFRHFGAPDAEDAARRLREVTAARGVRLLIGLDAELAEAIGADGVHLPERALDRAPALTAARPDWLITGAAHGRESLSAPGVDAFILSPVFPAGGASADRLALGLTVFAEQVRGAAAPVYALGGVDRENARGLIGSGACGLAGVGSIQRAFGPEET